MKMYLELKPKHKLIVLKHLVKVYNNLPKTDVTYFICLELKEVLLKLNLLKEFAPNDKFIEFHDASRILYDCFPELKCYIERAVARDYAKYNVVKLVDDSLKELDIFKVKQSHAIQVRLLQQANVINITENEYRTKLINKFNHLYKVRLQLNVKS